MSTTPSSLITPHANNQTTHQEPEAQPKVAEEEDLETIAHLEAIIHIQFDNVNIRNFSLAATPNPHKNTDRYSEYEPGSLRLTPQGLYQVAQNICRVYPEYNVRIIDMLTNLDEEPPSRTRRRRAQTFVTYERTGFPVGAVKQSIMIVRWEGILGEWSCVSYERMTGAHVWEGILS